MIRSYIKTGDGEVYYSGRPLATDLCPHGFFLVDQICHKGCDWISQFRIREMQEE